MILTKASPVLASVFKVLLVKPGSERKTNLWLFSSWLCSCLWGGGQKHITLKQYFPSDSQPNFQWQECRLIGRLLCLNSGSKPIKNTSLMNPLWHLGFPALLDSSEQCWRSFLPASIANSSLEMMSFFITSLWKRLGPGPEDRCGVLHSGPDGSFTGLQLSIGGRQVAPPPM